MFDMTAGNYEYLLKKNIQTQNAQSYQNSTYISQYTVHLLERRR